MLCNCLSICLLQLFFSFWPSGFSHLLFFISSCKICCCWEVTVWGPRSTRVCLHACHCWKTKTVSNICFYVRRSQRRCFLTTTFSSTWRETHQSTTCAVRSSRSTTPPKNSEGSWSKLEGWGFLCIVARREKKWHFYSKGLVESPSDFCSVVCHPVALAFPPALPSLES